MITKKLSSIREKLEKIPELPLGDMAILVRKFNKTFEGYKEKLVDIKINNITQENCLYMITDTEYGKAEILLVGDKFKCENLWNNQLEINQDVFKEIVLEIIRDNLAIFDLENILVNPMYGTTINTCVTIKDRYIYLCPQLFNIENLAKQKYQS